MPIQVYCDCGRKLQVRDEFAGQEGQCPACGRTLEIPYPEVQPADEPPTVTPAVEEALPAEEPQEIKDHGGEPLPDNTDFFVDPPPEIGPVMSAHSTLTQGKEPWPIWVRLVLCVALAGVGGFIGLAIDVFSRVHNPIWFVVWPLGFALGGALIGLLSSGFSHTCTYVGRDGVAHYACSGNRNKISTKEVFRFCDATELRTSQTMHYRNGVYQNTAYTYTWTDVGGRTRYTISNSHTNKDNNPPSTDFYHFARAAEFAWTVYLLDDAFRQIELAGGVTFHLGGGKWIRLAPGKLTYSHDGEPEEWDAEEVGAAIIEKGTVKIKRTDAQEGWFSSTGVIKFSFDSLANAQLFFHLLDKLIGVQAQ